MNRYLVRIRLRRKAGGSVEAEYDVIAPTPAAAVVLGKKSALEDFPGADLNESFARPKEYPDTATGEKWK